MDGLREFVCIFKLRPDILQGDTRPEDQEILRLHREYCQHMVGEGRYVLASTSLNNAYELCVMKAESEEVARQVFESDPAVKAGVVHAELHIGVTDYQAGQACNFFNSCRND